VPNRWTRVPDDPPPNVPPWAAPAVRVADIFMVAMLSRPSTGSLGRTWVTSGTLLLCAATAVATLALTLLCAVALSAGGGWPLLLGIVASLLFLVGSAAVALVGLAQRRR
jgi:hypothetical protein